MSSEMFEAALENLPYPILIHDEDTILYVNREALSWLKCTDRCEIEGKPFSNVVHEDGREAGRARRALMMEQGLSLRDIAVKLIALDGSIIYALGDAQPFNFDGRPAILVVGRRITRP